MKFIKQIIVITVVMFSLPVLAAEKQRVWQVVKNTHGWTTEEMNICGYTSEAINLRMQENAKDCMKRMDCETSFLPEDENKRSQDDLLYRRPIQLLEFSGKDTQSMRIRVDPSVTYGSFVGNGPGESYDLVQQPTQQEGDPFWNGKLVIAPSSSNPKADFQNFMTGTMICGGHTDEFNEPACRTGVTLDIETIVGGLNDQLRNFKFADILPPLPDHYTNGDKPIWMTSSRFMAWLEKWPPSADKKSNLVSLMAFTSGKFWIDDVDYPAYYVDKGVPPRIALAYIRYDEHADTLANAFDVRPISSCLLEQREIKTK
jgi:hypothetical protein